MTGYQPLASIIILTKNAQDYLSELLNILKNQVANFNYEIIVIDSASKDDTQKIATQKNVILHTIDPKTFNHGGTRNEAIKLAKGKYIAFLTQDALPSSINWLQSMISPFLKIDKLAGVFGKHIPRPDCNPLVARDIIGHFENLYNNQESINEIKGGETPQQIERLRFYSNVNSCLNREIWQKIPFPVANYCEDQIWAEKVLKAGYKTVYSPEAAVYHSHSFPFLEAFRRYYDEYLGLYDAFGVMPGKSLIKSILRAIKTGFKDLNYLLKNPDLSIGKKIKYILYSPVFNLSRQIAAHLAYRNRNKQSKWNSKLSRDKYIKEA